MTKNDRRFSGSFFPPLPGNRDQLGLRSICQLLAKDIRESFLALWYPPRVMLQYDLFGVANQVRDVARRHAALQE